MKPHVLSPCPDIPSTPYRRVPLRYMPALDGIRACATILVFLYHCQLPGCNQGRLGVDLFFVLSGFLITSILLDEYTATGRLNLLRFYCRRMLRLLPAFLVMLAVCIAASSILLNEHKHGANIQAAILSAMYVLNFRGYFDFYAKSLFVHCWSLAVEEQFYLIWPLVLWASLASGGIARTTRGVVQLALVAVLLRCYLASRGCHWDNIYEWPHSRADSLLVGCFVGCFVGCCYHAQAVAWVKQHDRALVRLMTAGTAALAAFGWSVSTGQFKGYLQYLGFTHVALVGGLLVAHVVMAGEGKLKGLLEHRALVHLGRISYGLYLWHYPVIKVLRGNVEWWAIPLIAAPGSYALAIASFRYVEQPMLRFKDRHGTRPGHETDRRRRTDMALPEPLPDGSHKDDPQPIQTPPGSGFRAV